MRILFTRFPLESADGGAENQTQWLMEGLRARGHDVRFLGSCPVLLERCSTLKAQSSKLLIGPPPVTTWSAVSFLWRRKEMQKKLVEACGYWLSAGDLNRRLPNKGNIEIPGRQTPSPKAAIFMLSLSEKLLLTEWAYVQGIKVFWIEHDRVGPWLTRNPWLPKLRKASEKATIVCVSALSKKLYEKMGFEAGRIATIPNGVPGYLPPSPNPIPRPSVMRVGTLARLSTEKGIDVLIHSIADLPEISLTIVGTGGEEGYLRTLIAEDTRRMGAERIHLVSHVDDPASFYHSLDVFVLPSLYHDPFGLVVAEAMVHGTPTIVSDACGVAGYLEDGIDALIVPAGYSAALTEAIERFEDPACRQSISGRGQLTALKKFSVERMIDDYEKLLQ